MISIQATQHSLADHIGSVAAWAALIMIYNTQNMRIRAGAGLTVYGVMYCHLGYTLQWGYVNQWSIVEWLVISVWSGW